MSPQPWIRKPTNVDTCRAAETVDGEITAFLWSERDGMQDLGTLVGGDYSQAHDLNRNGDFVGYSLTPSDPPHYGGKRESNRDSRHSAARNLALRLLFAAATVDDFVAVAPPSFTMFQ